MIETFTTTMKALSDPQRVVALMALLNGELCVCEIVDLLGLAPSTVSKHMTILKQAGLVESRKDIKWVYYRISEKNGPSPASRLIALARSVLADDPVIKESKGRLTAIVAGRTDKKCALSNRGKNGRTDQLKVLFLCSGNSCRSQMAEAFLRHISGGSINAFSAGLEPTPVHPIAIRVMAERGIDISGQKAKSLTEFLGKDIFDYIIFVCSQAEADCPSIYPSIRKNRLKWPFPDPAVVEGTDNIKLETFRIVRDSIEQKIGKWVTTLTKERV